MKYFRQLKYMHNYFRFKHPSMKNISVETVISNNTGIQPTTIAVAARHDDIICSDEKKT